MAALNHRPADERPASREVRLRRGSSTMVAWGAPDSSRQVGRPVGARERTWLRLAMSSGLDGDAVARTRFVVRRVEAYMKAPVSVRRAMAVIATAIAASVVIGGVLIRVVDPKAFPNVGAGMWWALQTVTTVGYGDVLPQSTFGRLVAAGFMVEAIAFVSIVTALITSSFVERARRERMIRAGSSEHDGARQLDVRLDEITARLERIERVLTERRPTIN
jgi:voltage-gated potassium channel